MRTIDWSAEYDRLSGKLYRICRRYVKDETIAEDLLQEVFLTAIQKASSFSGKGEWDAWMCRLAVNTSLLYLRKGKTEGFKTDVDRLADTLAESELETTQLQEEATENKAVSTFTKRLTIAKVDFSEAQMLEVIGRLPVHHRTVFNLYVMDRYSHKEIAQALKITEGTSKSHLSRARQKLQDELYSIALTMEKKRKSKSLFMIGCLLLMGSAAQLRAQSRRAFRISTPMAPPISSPLQAAMPKAFTTLGMSTAKLVTITVVSASLVGAGGLTVTGFNFLKNRSNPQTPAIRTERVIETPRPSEIQAPPPSEMGIPADTSDEKAEPSQGLPIPQEWPTEIPPIFGTKPVARETPQNQGLEPSQQLPLKEMPEAPNKAPTTPIKTKIPSKTKPQSPDKPIPVKENPPTAKPVIMRKLVYDTVYVPITNPE